MPIHDWTRVPAGLFHDFHLSWIVELASELNRGTFPKNLVALIERRSDRFSEDFNELEFHARCANRIAIKSGLVKTVAMIEVVSPGIKNSYDTLDDFVEMIVSSIQQGIHILLIDLFPPTPCVPFGLHKLIWEEIQGVGSAIPQRNGDRCLVSYHAANEKNALIEMIGVGDGLLNMPLFLPGGLHFEVPLDATYATTWARCPEVMREAVLTGILPEFEDAE